MISRPSCPSYANAWSSSTLMVLPQSGIPVPLELGFRKKSSKLHLLSLFLAQAPQKPNAAATGTTPVPPSRKKKKKKKKKNSTSLSFRHRIDDLRELCRAAIPSLRSSHRPYRPNDPTTPRGLRANVKSPLDSAPEKNSLDTKTRTTRTKHPLGLGGTPAGAGEKKKLNTSCPPNS